MTSLILSATVRTEGLKHLLLCSHAVLWWWNILALIHLHKSLWFLISGYWKSHELIRGNELFFSKCFFTNSKEKSLILRYLDSIYIHAQPILFCCRSIILIQHRSKNTIFESEILQSSIPAHFQYHSLNSQRQTAF